MNVVVLKSDLEIAENKNTFICVRMGDFDNLSPTGLISSPPKCLQMFIFITPTENSLKLSRVQYVRTFIEIAKPSWSSDLQEASGNTQLDIKTFFYFVL